MKQIVYVAIALCALLANGAYAQSVPKTCAESTGVGATQELAGEWFAWAYQTNNSVSCVDVDIAIDGQTWMVNVTYSKLPDETYMNQTITTNITQQTGQQQGSGVNATFVAIGTNNTVVPPTVYKLLQIGPNNNYLLVCAYTNATDNASSHGVILGRQREVNSTYLNSIESEASASYANFLNGTMYQVPQGSFCYTNSAVALTMATTLMAFISIVMKFL